MQARRARRVRAGCTGIFAALLAAVVCAAWGEGQPADAGPSLQPTSIDPPAPPGSTSPAIAAEDPTTVSREHEVIMTWLAPGEHGGRLSFSRLSGQTWSRPITIAEHVSALAPGDRPSLTVLETEAVRRTLIARLGDVVARSGDGGRTWTRLPASARPFASFAGGHEGGYVFWLAADGADSAKLLGSRILAGEALLDARVAGASSTAAAMTWDGPVVVYRDRSANGALDIATLHREDGQWTQPQILHADAWRPAETYKPQSGPQVTARRRQVAVAWYTEASDDPRVLVAFSSDAGRTFGEPVEVDARRSVRTPRDAVDVALDDHGHALVLWMTNVGAIDATLNLARVSPAGKRGQARAATDPRADPGQPPKGHAPDHPRR